MLTDRVKVILRYVHPAPSTSILIAESDLNHEYRLIVPADLLFGYEIACDVNALPGQATVHSQTDFRCLAQIPTTTVDVLV